MKQKDEKRMLNHAQVCQGKRFFDSKPSLDQFSVAERAEVDTARLKPRELQRKYHKILKYGEKITNFCGTCQSKSFFHLVVTLCRLQFFHGRYKRSKYHEKMVFEHLLPHPNQPCFQTDEMNKNY